MSTPIIPVVLNVDYLPGSDLSCKVLRNKWWTPAGRSGGKIINSGRYLSGSISYIFRLGEEGTDELQEWLDFRNLYWTMLQSNAGCIIWDHNENQLRDEAIGVWDGDNFDFQLFMVSNPASGYTVRRKVTRPIHNFGESGKPPRLYVNGLSDPTDELLGLANTIKIKVGATPETAVEETDFTVNEETGLVSIDEGASHTNGHIVYANGYCGWPWEWLEDGMPGNLDGPTKEVGPLRGREVPQDD